MKDNILFPRKMKWYRYFSSPYISPFESAQAGNHFIHRYCCMLSRVWNLPEMLVDVYVNIKLVCIYTINEQTQKTWLSDIAFFCHVQIHCACQCIMTLPPKILWPTALLNTWTIITFPKSSFYHTNHTFLTSINVWRMDFLSIKARIKKISSAQNTIPCREWLLQKFTFHHNEMTIF